MSYNANMRCEKTANKPNRYLVCDEPLCTKGSGSRFDFFYLVVIIKARALPIDGEPHIC